MLTKVEVRTKQGNLLSLQLDDISDGIIVEEIEGLDPVNATLVSSDFAGLDGAQYQSGRRETRNIKIKLSLDPVDPGVTPVRSLRNRLYNFFMPKTEIDLRFIMIDGLAVDIHGVVDDFKSPMFAQNPEVDVSITCFDPDFVDPTPVLVTGMFTSDGSPRLVTYDGTVDTGIKLVLNVNRTLTEFTVYHTPPNDDIRTMQFVAPLVAGDVLTISTVTGDKGATLTRGGVTTSILYAISPQSIWTELVHGVNALRVYAEGTGIPLTIQYTERYGGL